MLGGRICVFHASSFFFSLKNERKTQFKKWRAEKRRQRKDVKQKVIIEIIIIDPVNVNYVDIFNK